jgi:hypothetical protein
MAAGNTYTQIASTTLGSTASSVTLSSIPSTYTDLVLVVDSTITDGSVDIYVRVNGDSSTNYSRTYVYGDGTSTVSGRNTTIDRIGSGSKPIHHFMNYANTTTYKTVLGRYGTAGSLTLAQVALWRSTAAITSITMLLPSSTFTAGSTFNLYGITAA